MKESSSAFPTHRPQPQHYCVESDNFTDQEGNCNDYKSDDEVTLVIGLGDEGNSSYKSTTPRKRHPQKHHQSQAYYPSKNEHKSLSTYDGRGVFRRESICNSQNARKLQNQMKFDEWILLRLGVLAVAWFLIQMGMVIQKAYDDQEMMNAVASGGFPYRNHPNQFGVAAVGVSAIVSRMRGGSRDNVATIDNSDPVHIRNGEKMKQVSVVSTSAPSDLTLQGLKSEANTVIHVVTLPPSYNNLADVRKSFAGGDVPVFWHVPKAGGSTIKDTMGSCFSLTLASEVGGQFGHENDEALGRFEQFGSSFVNVDTTSREGIEKARRLGLASSGLADAVVTFYPHDVSILFDPGHQGRVFTILRDPIERAVSMLGYLSKATWERRYDPALEDMTVEEYAQSTRVENNWMTRFLTNEMSGELNNDHLQLAKEVLKEKVLVGLFPEMEESMRRFEKFFGWESIPHQASCIKEHVSGQMNRNKFSRHKAEKGSRAYNMLLWQNKFDMELYEYSKELFKEQGTYFEGKWNFRM